MNNIHVLMHAFESKLIYFFLIELFKLLYSIKLLLYYFIKEE